MRSYYITFRSVTFAQRGEGLLKRAGVNCVLQRTPRWMEERGCGYCLGLGKKELMPALMLLRENQVAFRKIYGRTEDGKLEELAL